jgi:hypothetical protein
VRQDDAALVRIVRADGTTIEREGQALTREESAAVFDRSGAIAAIEFLVRAGG